MQRLIKSSKFWLLVFGLIILIFMRFGVTNADVSDALTQITALYAVVGPVIVAIMNALEDIAEKGGEISFEDLAQVLKEILEEMLNDKE